MAYFIPFVLFLTLSGQAVAVQNSLQSGDLPFLIVLGIAQDGGVPQTGSKQHPGWQNPEFRKYVVSLAVVDPVDSTRWLFEATPDLPEQLHLLEEAAPVQDRPGIDGIFLTHAHMGHYTGLMYLGYESLGARAVPVYVMPKMKSFLEANGPWSQLVKYQNIYLTDLEDGVAVQLNERLRVEPFLVPHRQEFSEVVGYRIIGPNKSILFIPDIDSWETWDESGTRIEDKIAEVDIAYLDATFYANGEIPGRDMSGFPHPFITHSMERFTDLPAQECRKIRFIHLNHTNPALDPKSEAHRTIYDNGFNVAEELERIDL